MDNIPSARKEASPSDISDPSQLWPEIQTRIQNELSDQAYKTWFSPIEFLHFQNNVLTLTVPDAFYADWLRDHYHGLIRESASVLGVKPEIDYVVVPPKTSGPMPDPMASLRAARAQASPRPAPNHGLNEHFDFDRFVIGSGNRFAHAACVAVSEAPAKAYNPLFIYGQVGLGKTHLMQAVAHKMLKDKPSAKVLYISSERFTNMLIGAIQTRTMARFRERFRMLDILLVDDIHFIAGKESTMEEFFHTFNALYDAHKQIVVSSDRPPKEIPDLEDRLVSRFAWGLVADIQPPDLETRIAILRSKLGRSNTAMPQDVIFFIASNVKSNIRELEGAMVRVAAYSSLINTPISLDMARNVLKDTVTEEADRIGIETIQKKVADHFQIKISDMRARRRTKSVALPRQVAMYLVRELTDYSLLEIGQYFGGRDHSTVLHACLKVNDLKDKDRAFGEMLDGLSLKIRRV